MCIRAPLFGSVVPRVHAGCLVCVCVCVRVGSYIVQLHSTFQDASHLFFLLDFCPGGELWDLMELGGDSQAGLLPHRAAYYAAQIVQVCVCVRVCACVCLRLLSFACVCV